MNDDISIAAEVDPALNSELDSVSRRTFVERVALGAVAAAALGRSAEAQDKKPIALNDETINKEEITFKSGDRDLKAFLATPKTASKHGSVIVIHEIFGLNTHIKDIAARLAVAGYTALSVDFFTREGAVPDVAGGFAKLQEFVGTISDAQVIGDIKAAMKYLKGRKQSNGKVGTVGFCWGGYYSMLADGSIEDLNAAVAYYGRIKLAQKSDKKPAAPLELVEKMKAPLLGHFGALDRGIPPTDADALRDELKKHNKTGDIYVYEGANHAFNNDTRESYNPAAAKLAWERTLAWYGKHLK